MKISHSAKETYLECGYKYFLHYLLKLRPVEQKSALIFGDAVDQGLNHLLLTRNLDEAITIFHATWGRTENLEIGFSKSDLEEHLLPKQEFKNDQEKYWHSLNVKGEILLKEYAAQILPRIREVIAVQIDDKIPNEDGDELVIKTDFICVWEDGKRILFDNKTSSVKYTKDSVEKSPQLATYFEALRDQYKLDACGYIVIPKRTNIKKLPAVEITVIIDEVSQETIDKTYEDYDMVLANVKAGNFPKNTKSCIGKYGRCQFYDYCHSGSMKGLKGKE